MCDRWIMTIPVVSEGAAAAIFIINFLFPGIGTMILACIGRPEHMGDQLVVGIFQLVLFCFCCVGWFWAVWWSILVCQKIGQSENPVQVVVYEGDVYPPVNNYNNSQYPLQNNINNQPQYNNQPQFNNQPQYNNQQLPITQQYPNAQPAYVVVVN